MIGKNFSRFLNKIWNYIVKGLVGTLGVVIIISTICLALSIGSIILAILSPIWLVKKRSVKRKIKQN